jgi:adenylylsulfate reductase subunit A
VELKENLIRADVLVIGGGTAGCMAAIAAKERQPKHRVVILEKAHVDRSGCLAGGMNSINAFLHPGETPESFLRYLRYDAMGLIREDLVLSAAARINESVARMESWGLPIIKDEHGQYQRRGRWNLPIHGERMKPILAKAVRKAGVEVVNRVAATGYLLNQGRVVGTVGIGVRDGEIYKFLAGAVICATGGASGIYRPNSGGEAQHVMWYPPFNAGAGYAMGIRAGAELTGLEMRFIALRTKDVIAPTGTLALGFGAPQVNAKGEKFMSMRYQHAGGEGAPTCLRVYGPLQELKAGRGPCYMDTRHLSTERVHDLKASYLDMVPGLVLYWTANGIDPSKEPVELAATEPYIMGGHCQAGYWIDTKRRTTLPGLFACGDVAGGYSYKFVSGAWAEGLIAGETAADEVVDGVEEEPVQAEAEVERATAPIRRQTNACDRVTPGQLRDRVQRIMDEYAGGLSSFFELNEERLERARQELKRSEGQLQYLTALDHHELMTANESADRLLVAQAVVEHLSKRKETRWPGFQTRLDYPERDDHHWLKFVTSQRTPEGDWIMSERPYEQIVPGERYLPR